MTWTATAIVLFTERRICRHCGSTTTVASPHPVVRLTNFDTRTTVHEPILSELSHEEKASLPQVIMQTFCRTSACRNCFHVTSEIQPFLFPLEPPPQFIRNPLDLRINGGNFARKPPATPPATDPPFRINLEDFT